MSTALGIALQYVVIALAVLASLGFVAQHRFPEGVRRLRIALAVPMVREGRQRWLQRLGRWLAPAPRAGGDYACGGCNNCGPDKP
jgi:hypothetical protein